MLETFQAGVYALSFDWISVSSGGRWASHCRMSQIKRLSIWGLSHNDLNNRFETLEWAHEFFEQHTTHDNWVTPVHLGLHMIDNTHHVDLFKFISKMLYRDNVHLRSLDIGFEGDNDGVMSIHPPIEYLPPVTRNGVINQLVRRHRNCIILLPKRRRLGYTNTAADIIGICTTIFQSLKQFTGNTTFCKITMTERGQIPGSEFFET